MLMKNSVFIAASFDGFIADEKGGIEWLTDFPPPSDGDGGFAAFMDSVDAVVMGRNTFEKVLSFGIDWPYSKKVFVWSQTLAKVPDDLKQRVEIVRGTVGEILHSVHQKGFSRLYIDGGQTIQGFLRENKIHEIILTRVPIILGKGISLLDDGPRRELKHMETSVFDNGMVQSRYMIQC